MNCLILAAGLGSRLRGVSQSKPLTSVGGAPLIEHVIGRAAAGGASRFVVVTGYEADAVTHCLADLSARSGFAIECVQTSDWTLPNGHSVLTGARAIDGDFLLLMADHLIDPAMVSGLLQAQPRKGGITLAIDRALTGPLLDLDDATKVETAEGRIVRIGKSIEQFDAIDTGVFLATPDLADALDEVIARGGAGSLSEGVQHLADQGCAYVSDIGSARWIDVDSPQMLALAETLLAEETASGSAA